MTFWPLTNSDFPTNQTLNQFHNLDTDFDTAWKMEFTDYYIPFYSH